MIDRPPAAEPFVGIDVSKHRVGVHVRPRHNHIRLHHRPGWSGRSGPSPDSAATAPDNPRQVRKFAGAIGRLAKTDAIDAGVIAYFADAIRPDPSQ